MLDTGLWFSRFSEINHAFSFSFQKRLNCCLLRAVRIFSSLRETWKIFPTRSNRPFLAAFISCVMQVSSVQEGGLGSPAPLVHILGLYKREGIPQYWTANIWKCLVGDQLMLGWSVCPICPVLYAHPSYIMALVLVPSEKCSHIVERVTLIFFNAHT